MKAASLSSPLRRAGILGILIAALTLLAQSSGVGGAIVAAADGAIGAAPLALGLDREATVTLTAAVPVGQLTSLEARWGVRVTGFQHTYPALNRPVTAGGSVPAGSDLASAAASHNVALQNWATLRLQHMAEVAATLSGQGLASMEQNIEDLRAVQTQVASAGAMVTQITVRGPAANVDRVGQDALVRSLTPRTR